MRGAILICTLMFIAVAASAQDGNPGGMEAGTDVNAADRVFSTAITQGGMAEVKLGEMARNNAQDEGVKDFAKRMVADHGKANDKFADIAKKEGLTLPKELDPEHQALAAKLDDLKGRKFDLQYMTVQIGDHQETAQLLEHEISAGQNAALKDFASDTLPVVLNHIRMAQEVMMNLTSQAIR
jgi:putative membrane protein